MDQVFALAKRFLYWKLRPAHVRSFLFKNTPRKTANFLLNLKECRQREQSLKSKPYILNVELSNRCNFRCPFCPTGKRQESRTSGWLSLETLRRAVDDVKDTAYMCSLHGWGEPLLHPEFEKAVALVSEAGIYSVLSTNGSKLTDENIDKLLASGLDHLMVAIDGASSESYGQYRINGNFDEVVDGARRLIRRRNERGLKKPFVEWQFVVFRHNEHEIEKARAMAREIGFDTIDFIAAYAEDPEYESTLPQFKSRKSPLSKPSDCKFLWTSLTVYWDGRIASCCWDYYASSGFGNIAGQPTFEKLWNNPTFQLARGLAGERVATVAESNLICNDCIRNINITSPSVLERAKREKP